MFLPGRSSAITGVSSNDVGRLILDKTGKLSHVFHNSDLRDDSFDVAVTFLGK